MEHNINTTSYEPFPALDSYSAPTTPQHDHDAPIPTTSDTTATTALSTEPFSLEYEGPLYTEINIPLPHIPAAVAAQNTTSPSSTQTPSSTALSPPTAPDKQRGRSRTLSSLSPFSRHHHHHHHRSPSPTSPRASPTAEWPPTKKDVVKSREVNAMMNLRHQNKRARSGTVDALAIVPAVLVLSAELFTPEGEGGAQEARTARKDGIRMGRKGVSPCSMGPKDV